MRTIKFRAWDRDNRRFLNIDEVIEMFEFNGEQKGNTFSIDWKGSFSISRRFDLIQFTNCYDKNKDEVYEGDILQTGGTEKIEADFSISQYISEQCYIVGNVYESPELLK